MLEIKNRLFTWIENRVDSDQSNVQFKYNDQSEVLNNLTPAMIQDSRSQSLAR